MNDIVNIKDLNLIYQSIDSETLALENINLKCYNEIATQFNSNYHGRSLFILRGFFY